MTKQTHTATLGTSISSLLVFCAALSAAVASAVCWKGAAPTIGEAIWVASLTAQTVIRMPHIIANRANRIQERRQGVTERIGLPLMFVTMMALPLIAIATPVLEFADYTLPPWPVYLGVLLSLGFVWLFWRSHADLGRNWSPGLEVRENHGLVSQGVYRHIRHPMYAAIWLAALAQPLLIHNWIAGPLVILAFLFMFVTRIPREEAMMRAQFGAAYDEYSAHTKRVVPGVF